MKKVLLQILVFLVTLVLIVSVGGSMFGEVELVLTVLLLAALVFIAPWLWARRARS